MTPADATSRLVAKRWTRRVSAGFTLLEVMVSVAILAVALTAIFSSEAQAIRVARRSQQLNIATLLARCKMNEIEEQIAKEGLPAINDSGRDSCCEGAEVENCRCEWSLARDVLPDDTRA